MLSYIMFYIAGVISVSWYPPGQADEQGEPSDYLIPRILDAANQYSIKVFHIHEQVYLFIRPGSRIVPDLSEYPF